jgi:hypothetical protein
MNVIGLRYVLTRKVCKLFGKRNHLKLCTQSLYELSIQGSMRDDSNNITAVAKVSRHVDRVNLI